MCGREVPSRGSCHHFGGKPRDPLDPEMNQFENVPCAGYQKSKVLLETSLRKSKKRRTIASVALGACRALGQLWEALAELWEALGELWEGLDELWVSFLAGKRRPDFAWDGELV